MGGGNPGGGSGGGGDDIGDIIRTIDPRFSRVTVTPPFGTPADGVSTVEIEASIVSFSGRPLAQVPLELSISGYGNVLVPLPPTDAGGLARGTLASFAGERKVLTVRVVHAQTVVELGTHEAVFVEIPENTWFVRQSGSDANSGRTPLEAWRTIGHALASVGPGATVHVGAGTYAESLHLDQDSSTAALFLHGDRRGEFTGDAGEVAIDAGGATHALRLLEANNVVLRGLTLRGGASGLRIEDSAHVRVLDCRADDNDFGFVVEGAQDLVLSDCRVSNNRLDGMRVEGTRDSTIENNLIYGNSSSGLVLLSPTESTKIRFNTFFRNAGDHLREEVPGGMGEIEENILTEGLSSGLSLLEESGYVSRRNMVWANSLRSGSRENPDLGVIEVDPFLVNPFGLDGILGGTGTDDDDFRVLPFSPALDFGELQSRDVVLGSNEALSTRTTRSDDTLEWSGPDLPETNLGFHTRPADPPFHSLAQGGGRVALAAPGEVRPRLQAWDRDDPAVLSELVAPAFNAEVGWLEQRVTPLDLPDELLAAQIDTGSEGQILVRRWDGRLWSDPVVSPFVRGIPRDELADRHFDIEYESATGRAVLVVADGDSIPSFQVLERGRWSELRPVFETTPGEGKVRWVELVPRRGSNELALATLTDERDLVVSLWNGTSWSEPLRLEQNVLFTSGWRPYDAAFESQTGNLLVAWGFNVFVEETRFATLDRATGIWRFGQHNHSDAVGADVRLASDPTSNKIAMTLGEGDLDNDVTVSMWDGSLWRDTAELTLAGPRPNQLLELSWLGNTGLCCAFFRRQGNPESFNMALYSRTGWRIQPDVALPGVARGVQVRMESLPNRNQLLGVVLDETGKLFGLRFDGTGFSLLNDGAPLAQGFVSPLRGRPFDVALRRPAPTPQLLLGDTGVEKMP